MTSFFKESSLAMIDSSLAGVRKPPPFVPRRPTDPNDRRAGRNWSRPQALKNGLIRWAIRATLAAADVLPGGVLVRLGKVLGKAAALLSVAARRAAERRAGSCMESAEALRVARCAFTRAGENLARCLLLRRSSVRALDMVLVGNAARRDLQTALRGGRGAVFVSAHLGPFEALAAAIAELGYDPAVVARESYDPRLNAVVDAHRLSRGVEVIHRGSPFAAFAILRALRAGHPVGFLPDLGGRVPSVEVDFLGDRVAFPIGPQAVAIRANVPILVGTLSRRSAAAGGPTHELIMERIAPTLDPYELTRRVANILEARILSSREEWLWMAPPIRRLPPEKTGR